MKRLLLVTALVAMLGVGGAAGLAATNGSTLKRTLCHRTASPKKPYVKITISTRAAFQGHMRHAADIYPVPAAGCPKLALTPTQGGTVLTATLLGSKEVPPADPDVICYTITVKDITLPATAAHIHVGATGINGNVVVPLKAPDANGAASGCVNSTRSLVAAILANPSGYYANVHTTDYPNGAIRGQLA